MMRDLRRKGMLLIISAVTAASVLSGSVLHTFAEIQEEPAIEGIIEDPEEEISVGDEKDGNGSDIETEEIELDGVTDLGQGTVRTKYGDYEYTGKNRCPSPIVEVDGRTLVKDVDYTLEYQNNKDIGTGTIIVTGIGNYEGTLTCTFRIVERQDESIPIYRVFNPRTGEHFYTKHLAERDACIKYGWNAEGIAWYAPEDSDTPVYRVMNPNNKSEHHYTSSLKEKNWLVKLGWNDEGIAFYSRTGGGVPVYRLYHPIQRTGNHHYTTSKGEYDYIAENEGWNQEGVCFYVSRAGE